MADDPEQAMSSASASSSRRKAERVIHRERALVRRRVAARPNESLKEARLPPGAHPKLKRSRRAARRRGARDVEGAPNRSLPIGFPNRSRQTCAKRRPHGSQRRAQARGGTWDAVRLTGFAKDVREAVVVDDERAIVTGSLLISSDIATAMTRDGPRATLAALSVVMLVCIVAFVVRALARRAALEACS
jgi:hypothetical protein